MGKSTVYKWTQAGGWEKDPTNGMAFMGEIIFVKGDDYIEASAGEDACRLILYYDSINKKAAILHTGDLLGAEYLKLEKAMRLRRFNPSTTVIYLCGDEGTSHHKIWSDEIEKYFSKLDFTVMRISRGREKSIIINPGIEELLITDGLGRDLLK